MKYLHTTSLADANTKSIAICIAIAALSLSSGCDLPLCNDGDLVCRYDIVESVYCIEKCKPGTKQVCPEDCFCEEGDEGCISYHSKSVNHKCTIQVCEQDNWLNDKTCDGGFNKDVCLPNCKYGFDEVNYTCFNPCNICDSIECPNAIYDIDNKVVYKCDSTSGWSIDNTCFNDFSQDQEVHLKITGEEFYAKYLKELRNEHDDHSKFEQAKYVYGRCGECSENTSPVFCNTSGEVMHRCINGKQVASKTEMDTCKANLCEDNLSQCQLLSCKDEYGYVWINSESNHNHCGKCNFKCGASQSCIHGKCKSNVQCSDGDYVQLQLGARWVNAYCVGSVDSLKMIGKVPDNLDNAYILVEDIQINDPWTPLEPMENGIFFGNDKIISINAGFSDPLVINKTSYAGLFSRVNESYIADLIIKYSNIESASDIEADYFGMLAGTVRSSNVYRIDISTAQPINVSNTVAAGGVIGRANDDVSMSYVKMQIQLIADNKLSSEDIVQSESGVGGVIGVAKNIAELSNVYAKSETLENGIDTGIKVTGTRNVGGLIGWIGYDTSIVTPQKIDNEDAEPLSFSVSGEDCVGGVVGQIPMNMEIQKQFVQIQNFELDHVQLKLLNKDEELQPKSTEKHMRFFGGVLGGVRFTFSPKLPIVDIRNIKLNDVSLDEELYGKSINLLKDSSRLGGIAGDLRNVTLEDVHVKQFSIADTTSFSSMIGGIAGVAYDNIHITDSGIESFTFHSTNAACTYIGGISGITKNSEYNHIYVGNEDDTSDSIKLSCKTAVGGVAGQAESSIFDAADVHRVEIDSSKIKSSTKIGGFIGNATSVEFNNSHAESLILKAAGNIVGGMVGNASNLTVRNSSVKDVIITGGEHLGGIAGNESNTTISDTSVNNLNISGNQKIGGFIGTSNSTLNVNHAISSSKIQSKACCTGGLIGHVRGKNNTITRSIVESSINSAASSGGLIGSIADSNRTLNLSYIAAYSTIRRNNISKQSGAYRGGIVGPINPKTITLTALATTAVSNIHTLSACSGDETNKSKRIFAGYWYGSKAIADTSVLHLGLNGYAGYLNNNLAIGNIICDDCNTESSEDTDDESIACYNDMCDSVDNEVHSLCIDKSTQSYLPFFSPTLFEYINGTPTDDLYINDSHSKHSNFECAQLTTCDNADDCDTGSGNTDSSVSKKTTVYLESINDLSNLGWDCDVNQQCSTIVDSIKYIVNLNDCIPLYHSLSCNVEKFKTAIEGCTSEAQEDCDMNCDALIAQLNPDANGAFILPVPISPVNRESDDIANGICSDNKMVCDEGEIPLCLDDTRPACASNNTPTCTDGSTPKCYKIMVPSFCSLND